MTRIISHSQDQFDAAIANHKHWQEGETRSLLRGFGIGFALLVFAEIVNEGPFEPVFIFAAIAWFLYMLYLVFSVFRNEHLHRREVGLKCGYCDKTFYIDAANYVSRNGQCPKCHNRLIV